MKNEVSNEVSLGKAIELFLGEYKESTRLSYWYTLKQMIEFIGPARPLRKVNAVLLLEYGQHLRKREHAAATMNKHVKTLRTFFNWCVKIGWVDSPSPASALKYMRQSKVVAREKAMPEGVYQTLLDFSKWIPRAYALVLFLGDTGCRIGGAANLRWIDVDLEGRQAIVTEKGEKQRPVFYGEECANALAAWRDAQPRGDGFAFSRDGTAVTSAALGQFFERLGQRAGLKRNWGPHSLRHRKGYQFSDARVSPELARQALGHENVITTLTHYYPADWDRVQKEMDRLAHKPRASAVSDKVIPLKDRRSS